MGKLKLKKEIEDVSANSEIGEQIMITAISVAEANGAIGAEEYKALSEVANILGFNLDDFEVFAPA